jgi:hypothetical protein
MVIDLQEQAPEEYVAEDFPVEQYDKYRDEYMVTQADEEDMSSQYANAGWDSQSEKVQ